MVSGDRKRQGPTIRWCHARITAVDSIGTTRAVYFDVVCEPGKTEERETGIGPHDHVFRACVRFRHRIIAGPVPGEDDVIGTAEGDTVAVQHSEVTEYLADIDKDGPGIKVGSVRCRVGKAVLSVEIRCRRVGQRPRAVIRQRTARLGRLSGAVESNGITLGIGTGGEQIVVYTNS